MFKSQFLASETKMAAIYSKD